MDQLNTLARISRPFMLDAEIDAIAASLAHSLPDQGRVLEWGSGASTLYFPVCLGRPGLQWQAIEHDRQWYEEVHHRLAQETLSTVGIRFIAQDEDLAYVGDDGSYQAFQHYVDLPLQDDTAPLDVVIVDGRARVACMLAAWPRVAESGFLLLHDAERREYDAGQPEDGFLVRMTVPTDAGGRQTLWVFKQEQEMLRLLPHIHRAAGRHTGVLVQVCDRQRQVLPAPSVYEPVEPGHIVFVNTYYPAFVASCYRDKPTLAFQSYDEQLAALQATRFGDSDFYSAPLRAIGWEACDLIVNVEPLQKAWAQENDSQLSGMSLFVEQVRRLRPDVLYLQDLSLASTPVLRALRPYVGLLVGQIASPVPAVTDLSAFDLLVSSFPHFVERFRAMGVCAQYQPLGFDARVLADIAEVSRDIPVSFVGGISAAHGKGTTFLEQLAAQLPIAFWGYGKEGLPSDSPIRALHNGEVWGVEMFRTLARSRITVNRHIDTAEQYANNMRLFEATGCGALLITDYKDNLAELFEIGKEVVVYRDAAECVALIRYYQAHPEEAEVIARAGQERTLRDYSYGINMCETSALLRRLLRHRVLASQGLKLDVAVQSAKVQLEAPVEAEHALAQGWRSSSIPLVQRALVEQELLAMYRGQPPLVFNVMLASARLAIAPGARVLEIGCASGYYSEVLQYGVRNRFHYVGVDYSAALLALARDCYPEQTFIESDGADLPFSDRSFDFVISSCVLLHVPNYLEHMAEAIRVSRGYLLLHRTPICRQGPTRQYKKQAYGVDTVELRFNEAELLVPLLRAGFRLVAAHELSCVPGEDEFEMNYLLQR